MHEMMHTEPHAHLLNIIIPPFSAEAAELEVLFWAASWTPAQPTPSHSPLPLASQW